MSARHQKDERDPPRVMENDTYVKPHNMDEYEVAEWLESLDSVLESSGPEVAAEIS